MRPKSPSPVRRLRGPGELILLTVLMLLVLQGCGVSGGDGGDSGGGNTVPVVVTVTMPGPTVARAPEGLFQYLWAKVHQVVAPMMAWVGGESCNPPGGCDDPRRQCPRGNSNHSVVPEP